MNPAYDVLGFGAIALDELLYVDHYPDADTKVPVVDAVRQGGGLTATALVAVARLGGRAAYAGVLGLDPQSNEAIAGLEVEGVDCSLVLRQPEARPVIAVVIIDNATGSRTILADPRRFVVRDPNTLDEALIARTRVLFLDQRVASAGVVAAGHARRLRIPVVADVERLTDPGIHEMMDLADHLIVGQALAEQVTGESDPARAAEALWRGDRVAAVVTAGSRGSWYRTAGALVCHQPAYPVTVVDTTGCGDVFHGAYALQLARGASIPDCVRYAAATAALKATRPGGRTGIPTHGGVLAVLAAR